MNKSKVKWASLGGAIEDIKEAKKKYTPKPVITPQWLIDYIIARDRALWRLFPGSRGEIEEMHLDDKKKEAVSDKPKEIESSQSNMKL